jgi:RecB family exonuclease
VSLPVAISLDSVSPSRARDLTDCQLRVAFKQHAAGPGTPSDPQIVGEAAHATLAWVVQSGKIYSPDAAAAADARFWAELAERAPGREIRRARPAAARVRKLVGQLRELLDEAGHDAKTLCETSLRACDGALRGKVDLIIDSEKLHAVVDYKTGPVMDDAGDVLEDYATQLQLYAVLEHERSGRWPGRGMLLRFGGAPVHVGLDPFECEQAATGAVEALAAYNELAGRVPPASPSERVCDLCAFAPSCPAFWEAVSHGWSGRGAVRGIVQWVEASAAGGLTVALAGVHGTLDGDVVLRRLPDDWDHPAIRVGAELAIRGVRGDADGRLVPDRSARWVVLEP